MKSRPLIFILGAILLFVLLNSPAANNFPPLQWISFGIKTAFYPVQYLAHGTYQWFFGLVKNAATLKSASNENAKLKQDIKLLKTHQMAYDSLVSENEKMRAALRFSGKNPWRLNLICARVISRSGDFQMLKVEINAGKNKGIREQQAVVAENGVVGKVSAVFPYSAQVLLLIDPQFSVSSIDKETNEFGVVSGKGAGSLDMKYVPVQAKIKEGDTIVTSSVSRVFPPGLPIAKVKKSLRLDYSVFREIELEPTVDFPQLNFVYLIR